MIMKTYYVIASPQIKLMRALSFNKRELIKYPKEVILNLFDKNQDMRVFDSLEDALLYAELFWDHRSLLHHPVFKVQLKNNIELSQYPIEQDSTSFIFDSQYEDKLEKNEKGYYLSPSFRYVPPQYVKKIISAALLDQIFDFSDINKKVESNNNEDLPKNEHNYRTSM